MIKPCKQSQFLYFASRYPFNQAVAAFSDTRKGKGKDGRLLIKAMISGPGVGIDEV
jgi:D-xylulose reductase